jgi:hypothetical protein
MCRVSLSCDRLLAPASTTPLVLADTTTQPPASAGCETTAIAAMDDIPSLSFAI